MYQNSPLLPRSCARPFNKPLCTPAQQKPRVPRTAHFVVDNAFELANAVEMRCIGPGDEKTLTKLARGFFDESEEAISDFMTRRRKEDRRLAQSDELAREATMEAVRLLRDYLASRRAEQIKGAKDTFSLAGLDAFDLYLSHIQSLAVRPVFHARHDIFFLYYHGVASMANEMAMWDRAPRALHPSLR